MFDACTAGNHDDLVDGVGIHMHGGAACQIAASRVATETDPELPRGSAMNSHVAVVVRILDPRCQRQGAAVGSAREWQVRDRGLAGRRGLLRSLGLHKLKQDERTSSVPVLMVTALNERGDIEKALQAGCDDFLTKPVNSLELKTRVRSLLRVRHLTNERDRLLAYIAEVEGT